MANLVCLAILLSIFLVWTNIPPSVAENPPECKEDQPLILADLEEEDEDTCDASVRKAILCRNAFGRMVGPAMTTNQPPIGTTAAPAQSSSEHPQAFKKRVLETSGKTFEFFGQMNGVFEKLDLETIGDGWSNSLNRPYNRRMMSMKVWAHMKPKQMRGVTTLAVKGLQTVAKGVAAFLGGVGAVAAFLGPVGAAVGALFSIIALFIPQPDPNEEVLKAMKEGFEQMHLRFDKLERLIEDLATTVEKTAVISDYKANQDRIRDVRFKYDQLTSRPSNITLQQLRKTCELNDPQLALAWIHRRLIQDQIDVQLIPTILKHAKNDRKSFRDWSKIIIADSMEAIFLAEVCLGIRFGQRSNESANAAAFESLKVLVPLLRPSEASQILKTAENSLMFFNESELYYEICGSRKQSRRMLTAIVEHLDSVEHDLVENFGAQLQLDLKDAIKDIAKEVGKTNFERTWNQTVLEPIQKKFYWLDCWIVLATSMVKFDEKYDGYRPMNMANHTAQVSSDDGKKFLAAACGERDTIYPKANNLNHTNLLSFGPVVEMSTMSEDGGFEYSFNWNAFRYDVVRYGNLSGMSVDNKILVDAAAGTIEYPKSAIILPNGSLCKENDKVVNCQQCTDANGCKFALPFVSKYIYTTLGCLGNGSVFTNTTVERHDACSLLLFSTIVDRMIFVAGVYRNMDLEDDSVGLPRTELTRPSDYYPVLSSRFDDYYWDIYYFMPKTDVQAATCNREIKANCVYRPRGDVMRVVAIWSAKCDLSSRVQKAAKAIDVMIKYADDLFGKYATSLEEGAAKTTAKMIELFMLDPDNYLARENITSSSGEIDIAAISRLSFYGNNVITVLYPRDTTNLDARFQAPKVSFYYQNEDGQGEFLPEDMKRVVTNRTIMSAPFLDGKYRVIVNYYHPYGKRINGAKSCS